MTYYPPPQQPFPPPKKSNGCLIAVIIVAVLGLLFVGGCFFFGALVMHGVGKAMQEDEQRKKDRIAALDTAKAGDLRADGKLNDEFKLMSDYTDVQRDNEEKAIKGQIVEWTLTVYEVSRTGDQYKVQTSDMTKVNTYITVYPHNQEERGQIEKLKTGDPITVRGYISGVSSRHVEIDPAVMVKSP